jgi:hypothetical protein
VGAPLRARREWSFCINGKIWIFSPRLYDELGLERSNNVSGRIAISVGRETIDVVGVTVGRNQSRQLSIAIVRNLQRYLSKSTRAILGRACAAAIDQYMAITARFARLPVVKGQQKAVAKADLITGYRE